jgi:DNA polymerase/3'-5' exonuclease PolX
MKLEQAQEIVNKIIAINKPEFEKLEVVGSIRRERPEVNDIDFVAIVKPIVIKTFPEYEKKIIRKTYNGIINFEIYIAKPEEYEVIKLIRTGSKEHNIKLCRLALAKGWKLKANGEGLITDKGVIRTEKGILEALLGKYVEPKDREVI